MIKMMLSDPVSGPFHETHWAWYRQTMEKAARPDTTIDFTHLPDGYFRGTGGAYVSAHNAMGMAQNAYRAEKEGYDAFIIGCAGDLGLRAARGLVNIPVAAPTESAAHLAAILGSRFSIISANPADRHLKEHLMLEYGLERKLASVRCHPGFLEQSHFGLIFGGEEEHKKYVEWVTEEMSKAVREDGAEALFVTCTMGSSILTMHGVHEVERAQVVDLITAAVKTAETLVDLRRVYGTHPAKMSIYAPQPSGWEEQAPIKLDK